MSSNENTTFLYAINLIIIGNSFDFENKIIMNVFMEKLTNCYQLNKSHVGF